MKRFVNRFKSDQRGILVVDFMVLLPILLMWLFSSIVVFDAFVKYNKTVKATATVANLVSRLESTSNDELDNIYSIYRAMTEAKTSEAAFRLTSIKQGENGAEVHWSRAIGYYGELTNGEPNLSKLPDMVAGDYIMFLETRRKYTPLIDWDVFNNAIFGFDQPFILRFVPILENTDFFEVEGTGDGGDESNTAPPAGA